MEKHEQEMKQTRSQIKFLAPAANIDRAEGLARPRDLTHIGDEIALAWLAEYKRVTSKGQVLQGATAPTGQVLMFVLLLSPPVLAELTNTILTGKVNTATLGMDMLSVWESALIKSYSTSRPMPHGSDLAERPRSRGYLFQTQNQSDT